MCSGRNFVSLCLGGLNTRFYTERGIKTMTHGPGPLMAAHKADEHISLEEFNTVAKVFAQFLEKLLVTESI